MAACDNFVFFIIIHKSRTLLDSWHLKSSCSSPFLAVMYTFPAHHHQFMQCCQFSDYVTRSRDFWRSPSDKIVPIS